MRYLYHWTYLRRTFVLEGARVGARLSQSAVGTVRSRRVARVVLILGEVRMAGYRWTRLQRRECCSTDFVSPIYNLRGEEEYTKYILSFGCLCLFNCLDVIGGCGSGLMV